ncbi:MAG: trp operon repressor [Candidatus Margulisbacteria bacterium]|jgi:TrpR family trp operon transcriptional repressor|nr:trp operon repressor [Candidatus Margulisiibacteriota bacterium]
MNDKKDYQEFIAVLHNCDQKLLGDFLKDVLTPNELRELCQRWRVIKMLAAGAPQRTIARALKTSLCKITRGSRELQKKDSSFLKALKIKEQIYG